MKKILGLILIFTISIVFGQKKEGFGIKELTQKELNFPDLEKSNDIFSFRLENLGQVIDLRILNNSTYSGTIYNYVTKANENYRQNEKVSSGKIIPKVYIQEIQLNPEEVKKAIEIVKNHEITTLPSDENIKDWKPVLDGEWFSTSQKINGLYKEKNYGNPKLQVGLKEAKTFLNFHSDLDTEIKFTDKFRNFFSHLDYGCYSDGSAEITCLGRKTRWWKFWRW